MAKSKRVEFMELANRCYDRDIQTIDYCLNLAKYVRQEIIPVLMTKVGVPVILIALLIGMLGNLVIYRNHNVKKAEEVKVDLKNNLNNTNDVVVLKENN